MREIAEEPKKIGKKLKGKLGNLRECRFKGNNINWRLVYQAEQCNVNAVIVGPKPSVYKKLKRVS